MSDYQKILILLTDGIEYREALARATLLARSTQAQLHVQLFADARSASASLGDEVLIAQIDQQARSDRHRRLEAMLADLRNQGIDAEGTVVRAHPVREAMLAAIVEVAPDLTIKAVHHESALRRLFFTPDDWYLARFSPSPLLIVAEAQERLPTHVVAAVDPSSQRSSQDLNRRIVEAARRYAAPCEADLHLAYVSQPMADVLADASLVGGVAAPDVLNEVEDARHEQFETFASSCGLPLAQQHFLQGRVDTALNALADAVGAGVIVVGSNYRSGLDRFLLGSTTEDLLSKARHDVLVVKPDNFDERLLESAGLGQSHAA